MRSRHAARPEGGVFESMVAPSDLPEPQACPPLRLRSLQQKDRQHRLTVPSFQWKFWFEQWGIFQITDRRIRVRITCCHYKTHAQTQALHPPCAWGYRLHMDTYSHWTRLIAFVRTCWFKWKVCWIHKELFSISVVMEVLIHRSCYATAE